MILIAGDSYSDSSFSSPTCKMGNSEPYSWVNLLSQHYNTRCVAQSGCSNYDIVSQISRSKHYDFLIVNVSNITRTARKSPYRVKDNTLPELQANLKIASSLGKRSATLCWTPFPGYEGLPGVHFIPLEKHNELYNQSVQTRCTQNHMDREGHALLYEWMLKHLNSKGYINE